MFLWNFVPMAGCVVENVNATSTSGIIGRFAHPDPDPSRSGVILLKNCDASGMAGSSLVLMDTSSSSSIVLADNCKNPGGGAFSTTNGFFDAVYKNTLITALNDDQVAGAWKGRTSMCLLEKVSDTRTGGASFSIKMTPTGSNAPEVNRPLGILTQAPYESILVPLTSGVQKTITVFCAENYTTLTGDDVWIEVDYIDATGFVTESSEGVALGSDSSSWSDGTVSPFKMSVTLNPTQDFIARVRINLDKFEAGKYVLVDPQLST